jgi:HSP20 family protein
MNNDAQQQNQQQSTDQQQQSRSQHKGSDATQSTNVSTGKSAGGSREATQPIPVSSEVPARRSSLFNRGGLVTPWELMRRMNAELDRLVEAVDTQRSGGSAVSRGSTSQNLANASRGGDELTRVDWVPRIEVLQRAGAMVVRAELPGLKPDEIVVNVDNGVLSIWGERHQEQRVEEDGVIRTERAYGTFFRTIPLPDGADEEHVAATFREGVLELTIPVSQRERGRRIEVRS